MNEHTPGPWSINNWPQKDTDISIGATGTPLVAKVPLRDVSINEQEANARLIAAAPEMHALLCLVERNADVPAEVRDAAGDLLAKVEGGSQA